MAKPFHKLATLGDPPVNHLTSSYYVAEQRSLADEILTFESFESAVQAARERSVDVALIAGAYPNIRSFIMDDGLECIDAFVATIPPLVYCSLTPEPSPQLKALFLHPATRSLAEEIRHLSAYDEIVETKATSAAASMSQGNASTGAICNQLAADYYGLHIHAVLRPALGMPFVLVRARARSLAQWNDVCG